MLKVKWIHKFVHKGVIDIQKKKLTEVCIFVLLIVILYVLYGDRYDLYGVLSDGLSVCLWWQSMVCYMVIDQYNIYQSMTK